MFPYKRDSNELEEFNINIKGSPKKKNQSEIPQVHLDENVGPGQYDPVIDLTRKTAPSAAWSNQKTAKDDKISMPGYSKTLAENPGPGKYN